MNSPKKAKQTSTTSSTQSAFITSAPQRQQTTTTTTATTANNDKSRLVVDTTTNNNNNNNEDNLFSPRRYSLGEGDLSPMTMKSDDILTEQDAETLSDIEEDDLYQFSYEALLACEYEDDDEFDPFKFVAMLPPKKPIRPSAYCLPAKRPDAPPVTLVLDLDETLVHCSTDPMQGADFVFPVLFHGVEYQVYVRKRPYFEDFLKRVSRMFEVVVFTASQKVYADKLLDILDPKREYITHRVFRDSCVYVDGNYLKDLEVLGRDSAKTIIVDNSPQAYGYQIDNGIPILSWFDDESDTELMKLLPFLKKLVNVPDIRPTIRKKFQFFSLIEKYRSPNNNNSNKSNGMYM
jgi:CTD small phosphatase-like protein 2